MNLSNIVALQSLFFALILLAGGVAATFLPLRRPELIDDTGGRGGRAQAFLRKVTIVGGATTVLALFTVFEIVSHTSVYGKFSCRVDHHPGRRARRRTGYLPDRPGDQAAAQLARPVAGHARAPAGVADARFPRQAKKKRALRIFFATDLHGSDVCFRKFLAAAKVYEPDVLMLGGDFAGKGLVPVLRRGESWSARLDGER